MYLHVYTLTVWFLEGGCGSEDGGGLEDNAGQWTPHGTMTSWQCCGWDLCFLSWIIYLFISCFIVTIRGLGSWWCVLGIFLVWWCKNVKFSKVWDLKIKKLKKQAPQTLSVTSNRLYKATCFWHVDRHMFYGNVCLNHIITSSQSESDWEGLRAIMNSPHPSVPQRGSRTALLAVGGSPAELQEVLSACSYQTSQWKH